MQTRRIRKISLQAGEEGAGRKEARGGKHERSAAHLQYFKERFGDTRKAGGKIPCQRRQGTGRTSPEGKTKSPGRLCKRENGNIPCHNQRTLPDKSRTGDQAGTPRTLNDHREIICPVVDFQTIMFYVYVLESQKNGKLYMGQTSDLIRRLKEHNQGLNFSTKSERPWRCIYYEVCINEQDAKRRESYLKTTQGKRLLKQRLKEYFYIKKNSI